MHLWLMLSSMNNHNEAREVLVRDYPLTQAHIDFYKANGFVHLEAMLEGGALEELRAAVNAALDTLAEEQEQPDRPKSTYEQIFIQKVNLWQRFPQVKAFSLAPRFANVAAKLAGVPQRIWHDQALFKEPKTGSKTPWHQDAVYWPHKSVDRQLTIWIALQDATLQNGCMSFLPTTQSVRTVEPIRLEDPKSIFTLDPSLRNIKPQPVELKAGSCTFHHGMVFHYAGPNKSDAMREAFAIIYMPTTTAYTGASHIVTDGAGYQPGDILEGELFPDVST